MHTDFSRLPAFDADTVAALSLTDVEFQAQIDREQAAADAFAARMRRDHRG